MEESMNEATHGSRLGIRGLFTYSAACGIAAMLASIAGAAARDVAMQQTAGHLDVSTDQLVDIAATVTATALLAFLIGLIFRSQHDRAAKFGEAAVFAILGLGFQFGTHALHDRSSELLSTVATNFILSLIACSLFIPLAAKIGRR
jgi:cytochrome bd-type quinol oxidase subunit 2